MWHVWRVWLAAYDVKVRTQFDRSNCLFNCCCFSCVGLLIFNATAIPVLGSGGLCL
jgi:hypothetical protein